VLFVSSPSLTVPIADISPNLFVDRVLVLTVTVAVNEAELAEPEMAVVVQTVVGTVVVVAALRTVAD